MYYFSEMNLVLVGASVVVVGVVVGVVVVVIVVEVVHGAWSHSYICNGGSGTFLHLCWGTFSPDFLIMQS